MVKRPAQDSTKKKKKKEKNVCRHLMYVIRDWDLCVGRL